MISLPNWTRGNRAYVYDLMQDIIQIGETTHQSVHYCWWEFQITQHGATNTLPSRFIPLINHLSLDAWGIGVAWKASSAAYGTQFTVDAWRRRNDVNRCSSNHRYLSNPSTIDISACRLPCVLELGIEPICYVARWLLSLLFCNWHESWNKYQNFHIPSRKDH